MADKEFPQKKVLSLVLCVAVMLSVMVMGAGAAFSDQDKIENTEAVNMCTALNIIGGYEDGSYHPERNIERSEITKMICVALNGGKEPNLAVPATPTFSDVRGSADAWAEKYIESCAAQGIVSGVGGGRFSPAGNVTGSQLAKMLLVALGYRADEANFTGNGWDTNVNVIATQKGLYEGLENMDVSAALTRDNAAQMIWNALQAVEVEYTYTLVTENGQLVSKVVVQDKAPATVGSNEYDYTLLYDKYKAVMTDDYYTTVTMKSYKWIEKDNKFEYTFGVTGGTRNDDITFTSATDYTDLFAQQVNVVYKNTSKDTKSADVYGIYAADSQVLYEGVAGDIEANDQDSIKIDGVKYKVDDDKGLAGVEYYAENVYGTVGTYTNAEDYYTVRVIDLDGDDEVDCVVYLPFSVEKVTYVGTKSVTAGTSYTFEDDNIYDGIAKDDYAVIVKSANTADGKDTLTKADTISGKVTGTKTNEVAVDGTWYNLVSGVSVSMGSSYDFVVVNGYVFGADLTAESVKDVLFLSARDTYEANFGGKTAIVEAKVMIGKDEEIINVEKLEGKLITNTAGMDGTKYADESTLTTGLYTYTVNSNGNYELKAVNDDNNKAGYDSYVAAAGKFTNSTDKLGNGLVIADDAVVYVQKNDSGTISGLACITGKALKEFNNDFGDKLAVALVSEVNGIEYAKVVALVDDGVTPPTASYDDEYGYVLDKNGGVYLSELDDGTEVTYMTIWNGTEELKVYVEGNETSSIKVGDVVSYEVVSDQEIEDISVATSQPVAITGLETKSEGAIVYETGSAQKNLTLDEDVVVIGIDTTDKTGADKVTLETIAMAQSKEEGTLVPNAYVVTDTTGTKVLAIFYDVNNELDGAVSIGEEATIQDTVENLQTGVNVAMTVDNGKMTIALTGKNIAKGVPDALKSDVFPGANTSNQYTAITLTGFVPTDGEYSVVQENNTALKLAYPSENSFDGNSKTSTYRNGSGDGETNGDFSVLVAPSGKVTLKVMRGETIVKTCTIDATGLTISNS